MPATTVAPRSAATRPTSVANGPSTGSAYALTSEPASPKSRANASGKTTRSASRGASRSSRRAVGLRLEPGGVLDEGDVQAGHGARLPHMTFAAIVLAGGRAVRLDGADKASVEYLGRTLLEHALDALVDADRGRRRRRPGADDAAGDLHPGEPAVRRPGRRAAHRAGRPAASPADRRRARGRHAAGDAVDLPPAARGGGRPRRRVPHRRRRDAASSPACSTPPGSTTSGPTTRASTGCRCTALLADLDLVDSAPEGDEGRDVDTWATCATCRPRLTEAIQGVAD